MSINHQQIINLKIKEIIKQLDKVAIRPTAIKTSSSSSLVEMDQQQPALQPAVQPAVAADSIIPDIFLDVSDNNVTLSSSDSNDLSYDNVKSLKYKYNIYIYIYN